MGLLPSKRQMVRVDAPGRLIYRERNREYLFPFFEEDVDVIIVGEPVKWRIHYFFGWYWLPLEFCKAEADRILPGLLNYFRSTGRSARIFDRGDADGQAFVFYPELFEARARASDALENAVFFFSEYSSIDLLHEEYGLEVCGICEERDVEPIRIAMQSVFPHWHFTSVCKKDYGRDAGWKIRIHMFRRRSGEAKRVEAE